MKLHWLVGKMPAIVKPCLGLSNYISRLLSIYLPISVQTQRLALWDHNSSPMIVSSSVKCKLKKAKKCQLTPILSLSTRAKVEQTTQAGYIVL